MEKRTYEEIDLRSYAILLRRNISKILLPAVIVAVLITVVMSSVSVHELNNTPVKYGAIGKTYLSFDETEMDDKIINSCREIIRSDIAKVMVSEKTGIPVEWFGDNLIVYVYNGTVVAVEIRDFPDAESALAVVNEFLHVAESLVPSVTDKVECTTVSNAVSKPIQTSSIVSAIKNAVKYAVIAAVGIGGLIAAYIILREVFDNSVKDEQTAQFHLNLPVLGVFPPSNRNENQSMVQNDEFCLEESMGLCANLLFAAEKSELKTIMITSSVADEDEYLVAVNLASALAAIGREVLLIDANLRGGKLEKHMNHLCAEKGLRDILSGTASFSECLLSTENKLIKAITAGEGVNNPTGLILGKNTAAFMAKSKEQFEYTILIAPPTSVAIDAMAMGAYVDGILMAVRSRFASVDTVKLAVNSLNAIRDKMIGVVVTRLDAKKVYRSGYVR